MTNKLQDDNMLDSPLVVHKKTDASYQATASDLELNDTHQENNNTLERHRFKKEPKQKSGKKYFVAIFLVIVVAIVTALVITGVIGNNNDDEITTTESTSESTTSIEQKYLNTIVVKNTYIFVDGVEVDGIEGLQAALRLEDPETKQYTIIKENANTNFFNYDVLSILESLGFYTDSTEITSVQSSGLIAYAESTTKATTTTTTTTTTAASVSNNE